MKIARPTEKDINDAFKLLRALKVLSDGYNPFRLNEDDDGFFTDPSWLEDDDKASALDSVVELYDGCNIEWLLMALSTLIIPENKIINQESSELDFSPEVKKWEADSKRLEWMCKQGPVSFGAAYDEVLDVMEGYIGFRQHVYISDCNQLGVGVDFRTAIDDAMGKDAKS